MQQTTNTKIKTAVENWEQACLFSLLAIKKKEGREITYLDANIRTPFSTTNTLIGSRLLKENHSSNHSFPSYTVLRFGILYLEMVQGSISDMTIHYNLNYNTLQLQLQLLMSTAIQDHKNIKKTQYLQLQS